MKWRQKNQEQDQLLLYRKYFLDLIKDELEKLKVEIKELGINSKKTK